MISDVSAPMICRNAFALFALVRPCATFRVPPIDRYEPEADNSDSSDLSRSGARRELQDNPNPCPSCPDERVYWPESPINICDTNCDSDALGSMARMRDKAYSARQLLGPFAVSLPITLSLGQ